MIVYGQFTAHFSELNQRMIRTEKYKFIFNSWTLVTPDDLEKISHEMEYCISKPEYSGIRKELIAELLGEMKRLDDPLHGWFIRIRDVS